MTATAANAPRAESLKQSVGQVIEEGNRKLGELRSVLYAVTDPVNTAERRVQKALEALEQELVRYRFELGKAERLTKSTAGNPGLMMALNAKPHDDTLRAMLNKAKGWDKLRRAGADDKRILFALKSQWREYEQTIGQSSRNRYCGGEDPRVWIDASYQEKPTFRGDALAAEARRVLQIPQPGAAAAPKGGATKKPAEKPQAAAAAAPRAARKSGAQRRREAALKADATAAYGEWLGGVNRHGFDLRAETANEGLWKSWFDNGVTPARAVELFRQLDGGKGFEAKKPAVAGDAGPWKDVFKREAAEVRRLGKKILKGNGHAPANDPAAIAASGMTTPAAALPA
ncbi:MAG TPA: hypothetical protein VG269_26655 [Tepidisphaeraceae bacterium]|nr:hypothetical protein [Tepidisphaeraceae bacterium]